ncbi:hypothetical protein NDU88_001339, partial [Pleurodeles waltl]
HKGEGVPWGPLPVCDWVTIHFKWMVTAIPFATAFAVANGNELHCESQIGREHPFLFASRKCILRVGSDSQNAFLHTGEAFAPRK